MSLHVVQQPTTPATSIALPLDMLLTPTPLCLFNLIPPYPQGDGSMITVEPGLILGEVNRLLAAHAKKNKLPIQYKLGPDPSSIDSCMIGGVVSNNSSGMCCGVSQNTYHTLKVSSGGTADVSMKDAAPCSRCHCRSVSAAMWVLSCVSQPTSFVL